MSSSSSDSDSDDYEPIRRIRINIKPKSSVDSAKSAAANIQEIKASVESWRPLGPLPHSTLSRRQSSLSSVSSMSMYGLHSSPSCSSLVNEFNNRSAFSTIMSTSSRTSSPLTVINHGDTIPLAVAIQESIELLIKGTYRRGAQTDRKATANNEDGSLNHDTQMQTHNQLQEQLCNSDGHQETYDEDFVPEFSTRSIGNMKLAFPNAFAKGAYGRPVEPLRFCLNTTENIVKYYASRLIKDSLDKVTKRNITAIQETCKSDDGAKLKDVTHKQVVTGHVEKNSRVFELDMDLLMAHLKKLNEQSPTSSYYNVDVLRYQIAPMNSINRCPIQVCAYWKLEPEMIKLRIDFKHSVESGVPLDRLREISISVNLNDLLSSARPHSQIDNNGPLKCKNNNSVDTRNMNQHDFMFRKPGQNPSIDHSFKSPASNNVITKPNAHWNHSIKQLTWKFDSLESYQNTDGLGSLFAKIHHQCLPCSSPLVPNPIDVKFLVVDSTLSKVGFSVDSAGYKMTLLKREIRSGRYRCEPFIIV